MRDPLLLKIRVKSGGKTRFNIRREASVSRRRLTG